MPGTSEPERQRRIVSMLPDLRGKSVLDVAAWDDFFSFEAERLGAGRVVALDRLVWELDIVACMSYWRECNLCQDRIASQPGGGKSAAGKVNPLRCWRLLGHDLIRVTIYFTQGI